MPFSIPRAASPPAAPLAAAPPVVVVPPPPPPVAVPPPPPAAAAAEAPPPPVAAVPFWRLSAAAPVTAAPAANHSEEPDDFAPPPVGTTIPSQTQTQNSRPRSGVRQALGKPASKQLSEGTLFEMQTEYIERLGRLERCPKLRCKDADRKCNCLQILGDDDNNIRDAVATFCLKYLKRSKYDQHQTVIDWFKYACADGSGHPKFLLPFDTSDLVVSTESMKKMQSARLCTSALAMLVDFQQGTMTTLRKLAATTGCAKRHGNTGKTNRAYKEDSPELKGLRKHFLGLERLGEVRATRFITRLVDGTNQNAIRDDEEDFVFLPACSSKRSCYDRYLKEQGYYVKQTYHDGSLEIGELPEAEVRLPHVSLAMYRRFWKKEYSYIKVSRPSEDICPLCFRFANRHRSLADHSSRLVLPNADDEEDDDSDDDDDDDDLLCGTVDALFSDEPEAVRRSGRTKKPRNVEAHYCYDYVSDDEEDEDEEEEDIITEEESAEKPAAVSDDDIADVASEEIGTMEDMLVKAATHVQQARVQRWLYNSYIVQAIEDAKLEKDHGFRTYCLVVDYGQNMELPLFNSSQPGATYYFSPLSVYNLGVVDHAHVYDDIDEPTHHMDAHVYHEGVGKKGSNCVASLIMKTLRRRGIIKEDAIGGHLVIAFDNCGGQNKNNTVIRLLMFLYERGYFKKITFLFLVVGHTKNAADRLFNSLKKEYHNKNIFTMGQLNGILGTSKFVTVVPAEPSDFKDYSNYLGKFYRKLPKEINKNHIFSLGSMEPEDAAGCKVGSDFEISLRESDRQEDKEKKKKCILTGWYKRLPDRNYETRKVALPKRVEDLKALKEQLLVDVETPVMNPYKRAELVNNFKTYVPAEYHSDELYMPLTTEEKSKLKIEKKINHDKKKLVANMKKRKLKEVMDEAIDVAPM